ncbi:selenocysteine-specific translation elongation factor [Desertimonas flava]|uniref:selenocysteine-specific translation elongation factor n=1 Tax=Desertimonas flava TaxID=2064846 RepID=UPI000E35154E|nr:SelB C-terminal domain-containing protein [Desertimonas flava]
MSVIATAGHVDHGKSALIEALTGTDPDRFAEEKRRGLTIDLGFAHTALPSGRPVSFVDVPGHSRFLGNMLAGVGGADVCLFVVDASEGWRAQSEEHLRIVELLGIDRGVVAVTKCDLVDDEDLGLVLDELGERLAGSPLETVPRVAVSARTGVGLDVLLTELDRLVDPPPPPGPGRSRLWVDRAFTVAGSGTIVTGVTEGAGFTIDQAVAVMPHDVASSLRGIHVRGEAVGAVGARERAALNLRGVSADTVRRGDVVVTPADWWTTSQFDAQLTVLAGIAHDVGRRGSYSVHIGSGEYRSELQVIGARSVAPGATGAVRLRLGVGLPLLPGDRFILRESGRDETVGGGEVLDIDPRLPLSKAAPDRRWQRVVAERGWVTSADLARLTGVMVEPTIGTWVADPVALAALTESLRARVTASPAPGLAASLLDDRERALVDHLDDLTLSGEWVTLGTTGQGEHPVVEQLRLGGLQPPEPDAPRDVLRDLRTRRVLVERDGVWFHPDAIDEAAAVAASLLATSPDGFTVAQFRDAAATTRKYALALLGELAARGVTRRRDPLHIGGPLLPAL